MRSTDRKKSFFDFRFHFSGGGGSFSATLRQLSKGAKSECVMGKQLGFKTSEKKKAFLPKKRFRHHLKRSQPKKLLDFPEDSVFVLGVVVHVDWVQPAHHTKYDWKGIQM